ncbi:TonB-dependent receptor [Luteimonas marina]|uniref:TonB-dependent receptor n=1 Tax=Luteimonas marina TaxID=488485 RepID=A0A5C5TU73_9GAMM|nr:TonB-dependent receptor [Luteimonas marina]TWT17454.1 TonB-dependent receptor [Luteimonas marina]
MIRKNLLTAAVLMSLMQGVQAQDASDEDAASGQDVATTLDSVKVQAKFIAHGAKSAMKQDLTVMETPYSVAAYGDAFMKAIETTNVADLYNYMTGVRRGGNTGYDISIRGFKTTQADKNAIMIDGMPGVAGRFGSPPTIAAESVEVVKGPASILYGAAQPGGFVNIITKKPRAKSAALLDIRASTFSGAGWSFGDRNGYNIAADFTGPIDQEGRLLYRLVAEYNDKDGFRHNSWDQGHYIAPSLAWHLTDATQITAAFEYRKRENSYDNNLLVAPNKDARLIADIRTRYQEVGDTAEEEAYSGTVTLSHYFENGAIFNLAARSVRGEDYAQGFDNVSVLADGVTLRRRAREQANERNYDYIDSNFSQVFNTGSVEHKFIVGATYGVDETDFERIRFFDCPAVATDPCNVNIYNPVLGVVGPLGSYPTATGPQKHRNTINTSKGVYVSDLMSLSEKWKLNLGLRYADEKQRTQDKFNPPHVVRKTSSTAVLPTAGLLFNPVPQLTLYASYATSYIPQAAGVQDAAGNPNPFDPQEGRQYEIGAKAELLDNRLTTTLALFDIEKSNTIAAIACNAGVLGNCSQQVGGERSKGGELEVNYQVNENFQLIGGIAYTDAYVSETFAAGNAPLLGAQLTNSSLKSANLWARYDFTEGVLRNFGIGAGVAYNSEVAGSLPSANDPRVLILPSYVVADLALYYRIADRYDVTLKAGNLFDKRYYEGVNSTTNEIGVVPGMPRTVTLSVRIPLW